MIFDFSDKINQHGLKVIFSSAEESNILTKKAIVSMSQIHSTNIELINNYFILAHSKKIFFYLNLFLVLNILTTLLLIF